MQERFPGIKWERYADDIIVHCFSEKQAHFIRARIKCRLSQFKLELHPEKTRVVYTGTDKIHDHRGHDLSRKFTFLGYEFKPRSYKGGTIFSPGIGRGALKMIRCKIKQDWRLNRRIGSSLEEIAEEVNAVIRGWITYYGHHRRSELYRLRDMIDEELVGFIKRKHKKSPTWDQSWTVLKKRRKQQPKLFCHWYLISPSSRGAV